MPELQIDVAVANRFISSLSKSLQALCHGCMEFDSGIEIVGYININIDSGSKVDYVLNEKVLKSTTNSMTFVSNSFLARKEQQKQVRDGSCSPIPQPQGTSYVSRMPGGHFGSSYHRTSSQFSPHSHGQRGTQKRTRTDDWRLTSKKHHLQSPSAESAFTGQTIQHSTSTPSSYTDSHFKQPQGTTQSDSNINDSTLHLQTNIKKEALEADSQNNLDAEQSGHPADDQKNDSSHDQVSRVQVKCDPDESSSNNGKTIITDRGRTVAGDDTDIKGNFLEPPSLEDTQQSAEESSNQSESNNHLPFGPESQLVMNKGQNLSDEINMPSSSALNLADNDADMSVENESDAAGEYDQAAEEGSYSQSAYEDAGEGSSDAGQFEVIEIDDEDEDVQAMFNEHRSNSARQGKEVSHIASARTSTHIASARTGTHNASAHTGRRAHRGKTKAGRGRKSRPESVPGRGLPCRHCPAIFQNYFAVAAHTAESHKIQMPFSCSVCGKGYLSTTGLNLHMETHIGKSYMCPICDSKFTQKGTIKMHLRGIHHMGQCSNCSAVFRLGSEYNQHVLHCHP